VAKAKTRKVVAGRPELSPMQRKILDVIKAHTSDGGWAPSHRELADAAGLASTSSVSHQLHQLEDMGYIRRKPHAPRAISVIAG
jgi:repressor LexA